jgi:uncharacterized protein
MKKLITIWRFIDGKAGHEKQSIAAINALSKKINCEVCDIDLPAKTSFLSALLFGKLKKLKNLNKPNLIIGVGHQTHLYILFAKKYYGGMSILIMKPSLPTDWFDLCILPEHDNVWAQKEYPDWALSGEARIFYTQGPLVDIKERKRNKRGKSMILIGGPSKNYQWSNVKIMLQIIDLIKQNPDDKFRLVTSRRTPKSFLKYLGHGRLRAIEPGETLGDDDVLHAQNLDIHTNIPSDPEWINELMSEAPYVWVTNDSFSMIYEALSYGAQVGLLCLDAYPNNRLDRATRQLFAGKRCNWDDERNYKKLTINRKNLNEAEDCAAFILKKYEKN